MSQAECFCGAEKRMKVSGSQIAKLKSFYGLSKEVANTGVEKQVMKSVIHTRLVDSRVLSSDTSS